MGSRRESERDAARSNVLHAWAAKNDVNLDRFDDGQQWLIFAALQIVDFIGVVPTLRRLTGYLLAHCGMGLGTGVIASVIGLSARSLRTAQALQPAQILHSIRNPIGGHRKPRLQAEDTGVVARYLFEHPDSEVSEVLAFIRAKLGVTMDRLTLRRFVRRYGLGCRNSSPTPIVTPTAPRRA
jgi:transposase